MAKSKTINTQAEIQPAITDVQTNIQTIEEELKVIKERLDVSAVTDNQLAAAITTIHDATQDAINKLIEHDNYLQKQINIASTIIETTLIVFLGLLVWGLKIWLKLF